MVRGGTGWARFPGEINISILFIIINIVTGIVIIVVVIIIFIFIFLRVIMFVAIFTIYLHPNSQNFQLRAYIRIIC